MIPTINCLVTEVGEFDVPPDMAALYRACKIRKDGQPDQRTINGRLWEEKFNAFRQAKLQEYLAENKPKGNGHE